MIITPFHKPIHRTSLFSRLGVSCLLVVCATSCACQDPRPKERDSNDHEVAEASIGAGVHTSPKQAVDRATAVIKPFKDNKVQGQIQFIRIDGGVKVVADLEGLKPGKHGIHVHEFGDCSGEDGSAAGSHFNPTQQPHAGPDNLHRHVGDLGNVVADRNGRAHYERFDTISRLEGPDSIVGKSVIIHADADDFVTQPAGASGAKIACGIIQAG